MKPLLPRLGVFVALATFPLVSQADIIVEQTGIYGTLQIEHFEPIGQSFTAASGTLLGFEFYITPINSFLNSPTPITLEIHDGAGTGGAVLASAVLNLSGGFSGWAGSSFFLNVLSGNVYTATLDTTTAYWGVVGFNGDAYAGGQAFTDPAFPDLPDLTFRARFADARVPDLGSTVVLLVAGLGSLLGFGRRLRRIA